MIQAQFLNIHGCGFSQLTHGCGFSIPMGVEFTQLTIIMLVPYIS